MRGEVNMVRLFYTVLYILCFQVLNISTNFYIIVGLGLLALIGGILGHKFRPLNYLKMFDIKIQKDNYFELFAIILFLGYYYYRLDILSAYSSLITFPSSVILMFYSFLQVDYVK